VHKLAIEPSFVIVSFSIILEAETQILQQSCRVVPFLALFHCPFPYLNHLDQKCFIMVESDQSQVASGVSIIMKVQQYLVMDTYLGLP
jgi:hypothetical protein